MSKILIIGSSTAAVAAAEHMRRQNPSEEVVIFAAEGAVPYDRSLLPALVGRDIKESRAFVKPEKFFQENNIRLVLGETLARISTKRKQITTENKAHFAFDKLLITDLPGAKIPAVKGHHKKGIFNSLQWLSVKELIKSLPFADNIIVPVTNVAGFDMACALSRLGKAVVVLAPAAGLLTESFDDETASLLKQIVEGRGIRVMHDGLEEVLGDSETKAVRLTSGKVIAAEAVVFDRLAPDVRLLADSGLVDGDTLTVDEFFKTASPDIYACDAVLGHYDLLPQESAAQGACAAANLLQAGTAAYQPPVALRMFGAKVCDGFYGGAIRLQDGGREHMKFDGPKNIYKKIFILNDCLAGAVWLNAPEDREKVSRALESKMSLAGAEDLFLQSAQGA